MIQLNLFINVFQLLIINHRNIPFEFTLSEHMLAHSYKEISILNSFNYLIVIIPIV